MGIFGQPITVTPLASRPGAASYEAAGVYSSRAVDVATEEGIIVSQVVTLGIRLADFPDPVTGELRPPMQRDEIILIGDRAGAVKFAVSDPPRRDGQGWADLTLKSITPPAPRP